ncbi:uncharacterized protein VTP21DRAFT_7440 [Calcarisporiella thermophila]|uniref:uncharacterized protein n=1 Tax=Calcarisporiella thermophila TaxID=911321 RepID=UPI003743A9C0
MLAQRRSHRNSQGVRHNGRSSEYRSAGDSREDFQQSADAAIVEPETVEEEDSDDGGQTRCVCGEAHHDGIMIQCEECKVWQHCICVGIVSEKGIPDLYYCEVCKPENHIIVKVGNTGRKRHTYKDGKHQKSPGTKRSSLNGKGTPSSNQETEAPKSSTSPPPIGRTSKRRKKSSSEENLNDRPERDILDTKKDGLASAKQNKRTAPKYAESDRRKRPRSPESPAQSSVNDAATNDDETRSATDASPKEQSELEENPPTKRKRRTLDRDSVRSYSGASPADTEEPYALEKEERPSSESHLNGDKYPLRATGEEQMNTRHSATKNKKGSNHKRPTNSKRSNPSRTATPQPDTTPQLRSASPPAKVRYPSEKMSLDDMNKRATLILGYLSNLRMERAKGQQTKFPTCPGDINGAANERAKENAEAERMRTRRRPGDSSNGSTTTLNDSDLQADSKRLSPSAHSSSSTMSSTRSTSKHTNEEQATSEEEPSIIDMLDELTQQLVMFQKRFGHPKETGHHHFTRFSEIANGNINKLKQTRHPSQTSKPSNRGR